MDELRYEIGLLKAMNQKLSGRDKMYRQACETSGNAFFYTDFSNGEVQFLGKWNLFFPFPVKDREDLSKIYECIQEEYLPAVKEVLFLEKTSEERKTAECCLTNGKTWVEFETKVFYDDSDEPVDKIVCVRNITKYKTQNEELRYLAYYDSQTGLYNRNYFILRLTEFLQKAEAEKCIVSVLLLDLDDFKKVNDAMGLLVGDEVLQQYGQFLGSFSGENIIVCHMSSDVFCMAIYDPCGNRSVEYIHSEIKKRIAGGFLLSNGTEVSLDFSIGVAEYPESAATALELVNCAEIVMFKAKAAGKSRLLYFDAPILQDFLQKVDMENKLKEAVFNRNFCLHFQPQYFTDGKSLRGVEALIRWRDENNHLISPAVFIPIAEKSGAIIPIGNWVLNESIRHYAEWKRKYGKEFILSVNVSSVQCNRSDFVQNIIETVEKYDIQPCELELEITESLLIEDFEEVKKKLTALRDYGVRISLDDFGTGFSSLAYLNGLPIDTLKIDKSFVDNVCEDASTRVIMESIISMVSKLGYESIAEGVEDENQYAYMDSVGCDAIQGYLFSKPVPAEGIDKILIEMV